MLNNMTQSDENLIKQGKYLQSIGESKLIDWLNENYNLNITTAIALPKGGIGDSYVIEDSNHKKYFLKIHLTSVLRIDNPRGLDYILKLTSLFHDEGINSVPYPIKRKDGKLEGEFEKYSIIVTNYIDGHTPEITKDVVIKVAELIARIHQINKNNTNLPTEPFDPSYANALKDYWFILEKKENLNEQQQKLGNLLLSHQSKLNKHLDKFNELCVEVKRKKNNLVITHGDLIADNLICDKSGNIFIVDWDGARLSPPERDLWFFMGEFGQDFLKTYKKHNPQQKIDLDSLSFYMYKRYIEDIVYWANQILNENLDMVQSLENIEGIDICCLKAFQNIEEKVEKMNHIINNL